MRKNIFLSLLFLIISSSILTDVSATTPRQVLDKTAGILKNSGGIQATFEATSYNGTSVAGNTTGTIYVKGNKFKIVSQQMTTWFDGKTQWSQMKGSDEAYVSTPTASELQSVNPYTFVNLYKSGYDAQMTTTNYNGKSCHEVRLLAQQKGRGIREMRIVIDKSTYWPLSIRVKQQNGNWVRIRVGQVSTQQKWKDNFFQFSQTENPSVEIIDLR